MVLEFECQLESTAMAPRPTAFRETHEMYYLTVRQMEALAARAGLSIHSVLALGETRTPTPDDFSLIYVLEKGWL